jgi:adenylate cyclase
MSGDPKQEYFSDGLTEEIITALSKVRRLFVIARNSTFTYKGKPVKVQQIGRELGVRFVLEGSVRWAGDKVRISAQLIDATMGNHLWAERYDRNLTDIFAVQDEVTKKIITAMNVELTEGEQSQLAAKATDNLEAYLKFMQSRENIYQFSIESIASAKQLAEEAVALDPKYASAYRLLGVTHMHDALLGTSKSPNQSMTKAIQLVKKAIELDDTNGYSHAVLGFLFLLTKQYNQAIAKADIGITLNPNVADIHAWRALTLRFIGRSEEALQEYKKAIRINPIPPSWYIHGLAMTYCWVGRYEEAIMECEKAIRQEPNSLYAHIAMTVIYSLSGNEEKARSEAAEVIRIHPRFSLNQYEKRVRYKNQVDTDRYMGALRKAGLK